MLLLQVNFEWKHTQYSIDDAEYEKIYILNFDFDKQYKIFLALLENVQFRFKKKQGTIKKVISTKSSRFL